MADAGTKFPPPRGGSRGGGRRGIVLDSQDASALLQALAPPPPGHQLGAINLHEALSKMSRELSLSMARVEVRLHRTSRTSSNQVSTPPHFEYFVRCRWSGKPQAPVQKGRIADKGVRRRAVVGGARIQTWWDELPHTYIVNRRWADICKLHHLITSQLVYDPESGLVRVKTPIPDLPVEGDLDTFVNFVAATGDASVLSEKGALHTQAIMGESALGKLADEHTILVENKLTPYFEQLSKVLQEIPAYQLRESKVFRQFVVDGGSTKHKPRPHDPLKVMTGLAPISLELDDIQRIAQHKRGVAAREEAEGLQQPAGKGGKAKDASSSAAPKAKAQAKDGASPAAASSSLPQSASAPQLVLARDGDGAESPASGSVRTHYSFMAQRLPSQALEATCTRDLWKRMVAKERREIGRRTLLHAGSMSATDMRTNPRMRNTIDRLPVLPPAGRENPVRQFSDSLLRDYEKSIKKPAAPVSVKELMQATSIPHRPPRQDAVERAICEGIRVIVLGEKPPNQLPNRTVETVEPVVNTPATPKDVMQLYGAYRKMVKSEELELDDDAADGTLNASAVEFLEDFDSFASSAPQPGLESGFNKGLAPISWPTFFSWAEQTLLEAMDFRYKSVCGAFNRALVTWQQDFASVSCLHTGVSLSLLLQWAWPGTDAAGVAEMLTWICEREVEKDRRPTPPVMGKEDRRSLEAVFKSMDSKGTGLLTPEDIAGGKDKGVESALKNIVDTATVTAVVGDRALGLEEFVELMCEDDHRASEDSVVAMQSDGRKVVLQKRDVVNFEGWAIRDDFLTKEEEAHRRLVDSLEVEILKWRRQALEPRVSTADGHGEGAPDDEESDD